MSQIALALAPVYRGVGFIVFDGERKPLDWGVKEVRADKHARCRARVSNLLVWFRPTIIILERTGGPKCRRRRRMRELIAEIVSLAERAGHTVVLYERVDVAVSLGLDPLADKEIVAAAVAQAVPAIAHRLPSSRRVWESEKHSMALFEAAGLAFAHFAASDASAP
jgi:hypothetical protein